MNAKRRFSRALTLRLPFLFYSNTRLFLKAVSIRARPTLVRDVPPIFFSLPGLAKYFAKGIVICLLSFLLTEPCCLAADFYFAQTAAGGQTGVDCADAYAVTWFSTPGNWANPKQTGKVGPGDTVHLCGTISSELNAQNSGSTGSPITILFEPGAKISLGACDNTNGCLSIQGRSNITVDGGTACGYVGTDTTCNGIIENTANGTGLTYQQDSVGIMAASCNNCEIRNLTIQNMYVHSSPNDTTIDQTGSNAIRFYGSNVLIHNNMIHDVGWSIYYVLSYGNYSNTQIYNNDIYNTDHGVAVGGYGSYTGAGISIHNNHIHDYANWDTTTDAYHHDGVHLYATNGARGVAQVYNNVFGGEPGRCFTSHTFVESGMDGSAIFNNVYLAPSQTWNGNFGAIGFGGSNISVYNNTLFGQSVSGTYGILMSGTASTVENNVISGFWADFFWYSPSSSVIMDYNMHANYNRVGMVNGGNTYASLSAWQTYTSQEVHSLAVASAQLSPTGIPRTGSPVVGAGINLSSLGISALGSNPAGFFRPSTGPWDIGAYDHRDVVAPTSLRAVPLR